MATSEKKAEANRQNAQKSTGPKTDQGKRKSAMNARKHGLTAKIFVAGSDLEETAIQNRFMAWANALVDDDNPVALDLTALAVKAYHRADNVLTAERAEIEHRVRFAEAEWDRRHQETVLKLSGSLEKDPFVVIPALKTTVNGLDWLIEQWKALKITIDSGAWDNESHKRVRMLLGYGTEDPPKVKHKTDVWHFHINRSQENQRKKLIPILWLPWHDKVMAVENVKEATKHDDEVIAQLTRIAMPFDEMYTQLIYDEIKLLEEAKQSLIPIEAADRAQARARALTDPSEPGKLRLRYLEAAQRDLYRALKELRLVKADAAKMEPREHLRSDGSTGDVPEKSTNPQPLAPNKATENGPSDATHENALSVQITIDPIRMVMTRGLGVRLR